MLFLFKGENGPLVRAIVGALLVAAGIVVHGGALLVAIGVILLVWGGIGALRTQRARRQHVGSASQR
jgi:Flp pilus assembly protein TadB